MSERTGAVAGVVLAAGTSRRMGPAANKLLLDLDGETLVRRAVRSAIDAGLDPVMVVVGFEAERVEAELGPFDVEFVDNPQFADGINTSVRRGIARVPGRCAAAVVMLADMPFVTASMVATVVEQYRASHARVVVSQYGDVNAPPTLYDRSLFAEFDGPIGEGCGRRIVRRHRDEAIAVSWPAQRLADLDEPDDVERVRSQLAARGT